MPGHLPSRGCLQTKKGMKRSYDLKKKKKKAGKAEEAMNVQKAI